MNQVDTQFKDTMRLGLGTFHQTPDHPWDFRGPSRGAVLVEFTIVISLILFIALGVINLGSFLVQMNQISSASRAGARAAMDKSRNSGIPCSTILGVAVAEAKNDFNENSPNPRQRWEISTDTSEVVSSSSDPAVIPAISAIRLSAIAKNQENCLLCMGSFLSKILPRIDSIFVLGNPCVP